MTDGLAEIDQTATVAGRARPPGFQVALQLGVSVAPTREQAERRFRQSQLHAHLSSLSGSTLKGRDLTGLAERNLIGTPDDVAAQVTRYAEAGVTTMAGLLFASNTVEETLEAMHEFSETVIGRTSTANVSRGAAGQGRVSADA